jgi:hypothetical protein
MYMYIWFLPPSWRGEKPEHKEIYPGHAQDTCDPQRVTLPPSLPPLPPFLPSLSPPNKGSTELTAKALPEIVKLLQQQSGGDGTTISEAAKLMNDLTKKEASCKAVISNAHVVRTMIQAMVSTQSLDVQKSLAGGIHNISSDRLD